MFLVKALWDKDTGAGDRAGFHSDTIEVNIHVDFLVSKACEVWVGHSDDRETISGDQRLGVDNLILHVGFLL